MTVARGTLNWRWADIHEQFVADQQVTSPKLRCHFCAPSFSGVWSGI